MQTDTCSHYIFYSTLFVGDDAEEEDPSEENPFAAMTQEEREELYIKDPKKTLRGYFEREGKILYRLGIQLAHGL